MSHVRAALGAAGWGNYEVVWSPSGPELTPTDAPADGLLVPGLVDIHFHGAAGIDLMTADQAKFEKLAGQLQDWGYEAFLPTTVTAGLSDVKTSLGKWPEHPMAPGFHLEGPFISPHFPGAQQPQHLASPDTASAWADVLRDPRLRVVTMAPEEPGGTHLVRELAARGVTVSMGHTNATYDEAAAAVVAGAKHTTHTYNAMRPFTHRDPGLVGLALTDARVSCELIYDGHHVSKAAADVLIRCKGADGVIAVSDSTAATGLPDGSSLSMWGHACRVSGGTVRLESNNALAGSAVSLLDCFQNLAADFGPQLAAKACCLNPRRAAGLGRSPRIWLDLSGKLDLREAVNTG